MRRVAIALVLACVFSLFGLAQAAALSVKPTPPELDDSPLIITAYQATRANLNLVQIYNDSSQPVDLSGWQVELDYTGPLGASYSRAIDGFSDWLEPGKHILMVDDQQTITGSVSFTYPGFTLPVDATATQLKLIPPDNTYKSATLAIDDTSSSIMMRRLTSSGNYSSSDKFKNLADQPSRQLYSDPLYQIPAKPKVKIIEILAHSADCAPNDASLVCGDYVKLYNPTGQPIDLSGYSLRTDSGGSTSSISNTVWLGDYQPIAAKGYLTVYLRDDGQDLSLTNSGGYVWLSDEYGLKNYDSSITKYADAGSIDKQGWAWDLDPVSGKWQWTMTPRPGLANHLKLPAPEKESVSTTKLVPCASNQYRNPATNRCKLKTSVTSHLTPCTSGQYRNPATNRCKNKVTASTSYSPCRAGQERNPATHRCRSVLGVSKSYVPCAPNQARNPATHRCRNVISNNPASQVGAVDPRQVVNKTHQVNYGNLILAGTGVAVVGYGLFEWRRELGVAGRKVLAIFGRK